jgi:hypothetical protein
MQGSCQLQLQLQSGFGSGTVMYHHLACNMMSPPQGMCYRGRNPAVSAHQDLQPRELGYLAALSAGVTRSVDDLVVNPTTLADELKATGVDGSYEDFETLCGSAKAQFTRRRIDEAVAMEMEEVRREVGGWAAGWELFIFCCCLLLHISAGVLDRRGCLMKHACAVGASGKGWGACLLPGDAPGELAQLSCSIALFQERMVTQLPCCDTVLG